MATNTFLNSAINYDLFELKLDFLSELKFFENDVSKFGVVSVTKKHFSTSLVKEAELHAQIPQESKLGVTPHHVMICVLSYYREF
jgi:hypothetical protein